MHQVAEADYTGVTAARSGALGFMYSALTIGFFMLAWWGRGRQARR